jgi:hypothetical protein
MAAEHRGGLVMSDEQPPTAARHWLAAVVTEQNLFWVSVVFVLLVPTAIGLMTSNSTIAWLTLVCGAFVTMMSKFETLAELTMGPLKVRMREVVGAQLGVAAGAIAASQAAAKLLPDQAAADVITTTTNAAAEAVTAAMRANDAITFTVTPPTGSIVITGFAPNVEGVRPARAPVA